MTDSPEIEPNLDFLNDEIRSWVHELILKLKVDRRHQPQHPIYLLYLIIRSLYPIIKQKSKKSQSKSKQNRIKSIVSIIQNFFFENHIQEPNNWTILLTDNLDDQEFLTNINFSFAAFQNFLLRDHLSKITDNQVTALREMSEIQKRNNFYRKKLGSILEYIQNNSDLPYASEIENFIMKEPKSFLP